MTVPRWPIQWRGRPGPSQPGPLDVHPHGDAQPPTSESKCLVRLLERKKKLSDRLPPPAGSSGPFPGYYERATFVSFRLDGLHTSEGEVAQALARGAAARACRSRSAQRVRNHVAVLRHLESLLRRGHPLEAGHVIRWYTSVACGLSCGHIDGQTAARIDLVAGAINSPQLRLWPAVRQIAALHARLLVDPFVPGFNGILARLLLRYHLGRCGLPPVVFDPDADGARVGSEATLAPRLLELILESYEMAATECPAKR